MTWKFIGRLIERHAPERQGWGDDFPYLIDSTDQSVSFWSRRNHLDCNFLVSLPTGARFPSFKIVEISPHFLYPSLCGHFLNSLFHSILFSSNFFHFLYSFTYSHCRSYRHYHQSRKKTIPSFSLLVYEMTTRNLEKHINSPFSLSGAILSHTFPPDTHIFVLFHVCWIRKRNLITTFARYNIRLNYL